MCSTYLANDRAQITANGESFKIESFQGVTKSDRKRDKTGQICDKIGGRQNKGVAKSIHHCS